MASVIALALMLILPAYALSRRLTAADWLLPAGALLAVSIITFFAYRSDKRRAEAGQWRIPETTLHLAALLGGWPGGFLAQRVFRHKTVKLPFQIVFWAIVVLHQLVAFDSLQDWRYTKSVAVARIAPRS